MEKFTLTMIGFGFGMLTMYLWSVAYIDDQCASRIIMNYGGNEYACQKIPNL